MLKTCIALTTALVSFTVAPVALSQSALTNQDIEYLAMFHQMLLAEEEFDLSPMIDQVPNEMKISLAKGFCQKLREGNTYDQLGTELYGSEVDKITADLSQTERGALRSYILRGWYVGVRSYCPEYNYQLES
jgi:hypothetical protein